MQPLSQQIKAKPWMGWLVFFITLIIVFFLGLLASSIIERRAEAVFAYTPKVEHSQYEPRNEIWGQNFPRQYERFMATSDTSFRTKYNGNAPIDMLERNPRMVFLWAGYGFSKQYDQAKGHYYAIKDIREILRTGAPVDGRSSPMPNTCWTCKSPDVPRVMNEIGIAEFYSGSWEELGHQIVNPIGCADCHDANSMDLKITRPALVEAFERRDMDIHRTSHQERRRLVCAQCHVEYYFKGEGKYLTFPWDEGTSVEAMEAYYDKFDFKDWIHPISKAPMIKAQHPDYEIFMTGIHAQRGLACADCHMPYTEQGGVKFTDHKIVSPLYFVEKTCMVCHTESQEELFANVYERQDKIKQSQHRLEKILVRAHMEAGKAWELGATEEEMTAALQDIRHAQWKWDFVTASHGASFHSPIECNRILAEGIYEAQEARVKLSKILVSKGYNQTVPYPDIETKAKAQEFVGLDMEKLNSQKEKFLEEVVPEWAKKADEREQGYQVSRNTK